MKKLLLLFIGSLFIYIPSFSQISDKQNLFEDNYNWKINLAGTFVLFSDIPAPTTSGNWPAPTTTIRTRVGFSTNISYLLRLNDRFTYCPGISYYLITFNSDQAAGNINYYDVTNRLHYLSLVNKMEYRINPKITTSLGFSLDQILTGKVRGEMHITHPDDPVLPEVAPITYETTTLRSQKGFYLSLPVSISYLIYNRVNKYSVSLFTQIKIPAFYYDGITLWFGSDMYPLLYEFDGGTWAGIGGIQDNRNITIGLSVNF